MLQWIAMVCSLAALLVGGLSVPGEAAVEWSRQQVLKTDGVPVDIAASADGKYTFVLTNTGRVVIYSTDGAAQGEIEVGKNITGLASSPAGDQLFLIDGSSNAVQVLAVNFIQQISEIDAPVKGKADAPVTIALFSDFQ
jgi:DNA-binding beta-propeller fold protein YncE